MSSQFARLKHALNRASTTSVGPVQVAVFADDLHSILAHYITVSTELAELKAAPVQQEPVGSVYRNSVTGEYELLDYRLEQPLGTHQDIYTHHAPVQQEPVAYMVKAHERVQKIVVSADVADEIACKWRESDPEADSFPLYSGQQLEDAIAKRDANWQSIMTAATERCFGKDDKRIAELEAQNAKLVEALKLATSFKEGGTAMARAALASTVGTAPVQAQSEPVVHQHGFAKQNATLRTINESLDKQLDEVMRERDERDDVIDKLLDIVLGEDRYEWSSHYGFADAIAEVEERMNAAPVQQDTNKLLADKERLERLLTTSSNSERILRIRIVELEGASGYAQSQLQLCDTRIVELEAQNKALLGALKWLDRWMGDKQLLECANKVRSAIAAVEGEKKS